MGAEPWLYFVPYQADLNRALEELKQREFKAGRYNPVTPFLANIFPPGPDAPAPGAKHASIDAARKAADANGTRSILDIDRVANDPDFGVVVPLGETQLQSLYGTAQPTRETVEASPDFFEDIERGQGVCLIVYRDGKPVEICFAGYSYD